VHSPISPAEEGLGLATNVAGVTGHVVLECGRDGSGLDSIAVWHVDPGGLPVGAWIVGVETLASDSAAAQRLLGLTLRRSVLCWDTGTPAEVLDGLATWAGAVQAQRWTQTAVCLPDALVEIAEHRQRHAEAVDAYRTSHPKANVAPLVWRTDVPAGVASRDELQKRAKLAPPVADCDVAARALQVVRLTRWTVELWQQTETARLRRKYLRAQFGDEAPLPPGWLARLRTANTPDVRR
jgi:hypothetical protein